MLSICVRVKAAPDDRWYLFRGYPRVAVHVKQKNWAYSIYSKAAGWFPVKVNDVVESSSNPNIVMYFGFA